MVTNIANIIEILPNVGNIIAFVSGGLLVYFGNIYGTWIRNQYEIQYGQKERHTKLLKAFKSLVDKFNDIDITYRIQHLSNYKRETYLVECNKTIYDKESGIVSAENYIDEMFEKLNVELVFIDVNNSLMSIDISKSYNTVTSNQISTVNGN